MTKQHRWTPKEINMSVGLLRAAITVEQACSHTPKVLGFQATPDQLQKAFKARGMPAPSAYLWDGIPGHLADVSAKTTDFSALVKAAKSKPSFSALCDTLDLSPKALTQLLADAKSSGLALRVAPGGVGVGHAEPTGVQDTGIVPPTVGKRFRLGVISDLHLGSKYALRAQLRDCIKRLYRAKVRDIVIVGDLLDGCYRHGEFELSHSGLADQTTDLLATLPQYPGLTYHAITGNHDFTFTEKTGVDVGAYIVGQFAAAGRKDLKFYGDRAATLRIGGTTVRLLHPLGSCSYAISYKLQKFVEAFDSGEKPGVLLVGHYHRSCYVYSRGVHTLACPTFQGPGSAFGRALGLGSQAIGGLLLSWKLTEVGTLREFGIRPISYFKAEQPKETV